MSFPEFCFETAAGCPTDPPVLMLSFGTRETVTAVIKTRNGDPMPLTPANKHRLTLVVKQEPRCWELFAKAGSIVGDGSTGEVEFAFTDTELEKAGLLYGELVLEKDFAVTPDPADWSVIRRVACWMNVDGSLDLRNPNMPENLPVTVQSIREAVRDSCRQQNYLLDAQEFTDSEIAKSIADALQEWNTTRPVVKIALFSPSNFPYGSLINPGVLSRLYHRVGLNYRRNALQYQAAGTNVGDKDMWQTYLQMAESLGKQYSYWVQQEKLAINVNQAFGYSQIPSFGGGMYSNRRG